MKTETLKQVPKESRKITRIYFNFFNVAKLENLKEMDKFPHTA